MTDIEKTVKTALWLRGFSNEDILDNRGLIGATIDETILAVVKNFNNQAQTGEKNKDD